MLSFCLCMYVYMCVRVCMCTCMCVRTCVSLFRCDPLFSWPFTKYFSLLLDSQFPPLLLLLSV